jgi:hypothetical protein
MLNQNQKIYIFFGQFHQVLVMRKEYDLGPGEQLRQRFQGCGRAVVINKALSFSAP